MKMLLSYFQTAETGIKALISHLVFAVTNDEIAIYRDECKKTIPKDIFSLLDATLSIDKEEFKKTFAVRIAPDKKATFTFIDLFAGIGGFRIAMQNNRGRCVFSSEWNSSAQETYAYNFGETPFGDITLDSIKNLIPSRFDILCAGFPCQAFSIAGYQKGFEDTRGTLFFDVAKILDAHRPRAFYLENVKNLQRHDYGRTFKKIMDVLENDLGYKVFVKVMSPDEYANIPQNRERIFIIGFNPQSVAKSAIESFRFPSKITLTKKIRECIDEDVTDETFYYTPKYGCYDEIEKGVRRMDTVYQWRRQYVRENKNDMCPTLTANMGTGGHNVPLIRVKNGVRKLTPRECLNFQGFPTSFEFPDIAMSKRYMQAGNSVVVPLIQRVAKEIARVLNE